MALVHTRALILRHTNYGETDRIATLFSREFGKIQAVAKGGRRQKSRLLSASQAFCHGDYVLYKGSNLYTISQCNIIDTFYNLVTDVNRLAYGSYILNLCNEVIQEEGNRSLFSLLVNTLRTLSDSKSEAKKTVKIFELKFLDILGYKPNTHNCVNCQGEIKGEFVFSPGQGGILCSKCMEQYNDEIGGISLGALKTIEYILGKDLKKLESLRINGSIEHELDRLTEAYIRYILEKDFKLWDFMKKYSI